MRKQRVPPFVRVFVLRGGASSRMGRDKSELRLGGRTMFEIVEQVALRTRRPLHAIKKDVIQKAGPLSGVVTAFQNEDCEGGLFLSCDMPFITSDLLWELLKRFERTGRAVFTRAGELAGFPFVLPREAGAVAKQNVAEGKLSLQGLARQLNAEYVDWPKVAELFNINTPGEFREATQRWNELEKERARTVLEVRNLTIRRGSTELMRDFSWAVKKKEHWVLLGPNGSGKTSLLSALLGYLTPSGGEIYMLGQEYGYSDWPALRRNIGLVSSTIRQMMPESEPAWITVAGGRYAMIDFWGTPPKKDKAAAVRMLRQVECLYLAERPWAVLSQGERQRVLIARALMANPALLILDEPCAGLDPAAREHFLQFLEMTGRRKRAPSLVLVTHHVEEIMPVFSHALLLKDGRKLTEGPVPEVLNVQNLTEAFSCQIAVKRSERRYRLEVRQNPAVII